LCPGFLRPMIPRCSLAIPGAGCLDPPLACASACTGCGFLGLEAGVVQRHAPDSLVLLSGLQCGRYQLLEEFDDDKRSCRWVAPRRQDRARTFASHAHAAHVHCNCHSRPFDVHMVGRQSAAGRVLLPTAGNRRLCRERLSRHNERRRSKRPPGVPPDTAAANGCSLSGFPAALARGADPRPQRFASPSRGLDAWVSASTVPFTRRLRGQPADLAHGDNDVDQHGSGWPLAQSAKRQRASALHAPHYGSCGDGSERSAAAAAALAETWRAASFVRSHSDPLPTNRSPHVVRDIASMGDDVRY
jgi:SBP domain